MADLARERVRCTGVTQVRDRVLNRLAKTEAGMAGDLSPEAPGRIDGPDVPVILGAGTAPSPKPTPQPGVAPAPSTGGPEPAKLNPADCPFDLEVATPYAVDLRRLCELNGTQVPPEVAAKLGPNIPVLVYHRMTPFAQAGQKSHGIWGMGYAVRLLGLPEATTVDLVPSSKLATVASVNFKVASNLEGGASFSVAAPGSAGLEMASSADLASTPGLSAGTFTVGVGGGGEIEPATGLPSGSGPAIPGWPISEARLSLSADARFAFLLGLDLDLSLLEVQAGPVGAGGARWNLYRRGRRIDVTQSLVHTLTIPSGATQLRLRVTTWISESGLFGGPATRWTFTKRFTVSLQGL
jgi:hypothetical protein